MTLAEKIHWFALDFNLTLPDDIEGYMLQLVAEALRELHKLGEPEGSYEEMLYIDYLEMHNRAVEIFNELTKEKN